MTVNILFLLLFLLFFSLKIFLNQLEYFGRYVLLYQIPTDSVVIFQQ